MGTVSLRERPGSGGLCGGGEVLGHTPWEAAGSRGGTETPVGVDRRGFGRGKGYVPWELRERLEALLVPLLPPGRPPSSIPLPPPGSFLHTTLTLVPGLQPRSSRVCR